MIAMTGGGTGGHLSIVKALCEEYNQNGIKPIYIGSVNGQDRHWFENYSGFSDCYFLQSGGVVNKRGLKKIFSLLNIIKQAFACKKIFKKHNVTTVFSVGGYSAAPAALATILTRKTLFIHEQNAVLGRLNRLLKPYAKELFSSYENASFYTPYPVSKRFFEAKRVRKDIKKVLFLGGSQGASFINSLAKEMAKDLEKRGIGIIHQCGSKDLEELRIFYTKNSIKVDLFDFDKSLHAKMKEADFAISRAGASSLWELVACGLPTFFIPFPFSAANHQYYNAKSLSDKKVAYLSNQDSVKKEDILRIIDSINVENISKKLLSCVDEDGAKKIYEEIESAK